MADTLTVADRQQEVRSRLPLPFRTAFIKAMDLRQDPGVGLRRRPDDGDQPLNGELRNDHLHLVMPASCAAAAIEQLAGTGDHLGPLY